MHQAGHTPVNPYHSYADTTYTQELPCKGLALTPPVVGRIAIGKVVFQDGTRLPTKNDEFTITQVQTLAGWKLHPLDAELRVNACADTTEPDATSTPLRRQAKLRAIPVRLLFNDPD